MKFLKPIEVQAGISDGDPTNPLGLPGYLLSSDGSNVNWVSPGGLSAETAEAIVQPIKANEALTKGDPVYIVGYQNGQNVNIVAKADSSDAAKMPVVGLVDDDYASNNFGTMTAFGSFNGNFDTTGGTENWAVGDIIFVKAGGGLTNVKPTGTDLIQNIAIVSRVQQNTGELEVIALGRTNDVPNLPTGRLFVGTAANTSLASDVIYVDDTNDRVGIGTNSPGGKLDIAYTGTGGTGTFGIGEGLNITSLSPNITFNDNSSGVDNYSIHLNQNVFTIGRYTSATAQNPDLVLNNGNVGIGTTSPLRSLSVFSASIVSSEFKGSNTGHLIDISNSNASPTYNGIRFQHNNTFKMGVTHIADGTTRGYIQIGNGYATGDEILVVDGRTSNVGIGTTSPGYKLDVVGSIKASVQGRFASGSAATPSYSFDADSDSGMFRATTNALGFSTAGSERMRIDSSGNVGIGTTSPTNKLDIRQSTSGGSDVLGTGAITIGSDNPYWTFRGTATSLQDLAFDRRYAGAWVESMRIQRSTGNVGIGTTSPTQKLHVSGNARVTGAYYDSNNSPGTANQVLVSTATGTDWVDGSGSSIIGGPYLPLAGNTTATAMTGDIYLANTQQVRFLTSGNLVGLRLQSSGTSSFIDNEVGDMYIRQEADGGNIFFQADDGSGGNTTYFSVRPSNGARTQFEKNTRHNDGIKAFFGTGEDLQIYHDGTNSHIDQNVSGDLYIKNSIVDGDILFQGDDGSGTAVTNYFTINGGGEETRFQKNTRHNDDVIAQFGNSDDLQIYHDSNDNNSYIKEVGSGSLQIWAKDFEVYNAGGTETLINADVNAGVQLYFDNSPKIATTTTGVTVTGEIIANGNITTATTGGAALNLRRDDTSISGTNTLGSIAFQGDDPINGTFNDGAAIFGKADGSWASGSYPGQLLLQTRNTSGSLATALTLAKDQTSTFGAKAYGVAPITSDPSSTIATKGYVDSLITGATIYRGTWDPDKTQNSGYGVPDLSAVTQTSGYYYICSDIGIAEPNGPGCEPNSWAVGDWVIWNDDVPDCAGTGTGAWQKIDNTSVLSGVGTGQTVALWEGPNTVTDSETLGNAPITVSGNNTTFAGTIDSGDIFIDNGAVPKLKITDSGNGGGGGASGKITYANTAGNAIGIGYAGNDTTSSNLIISTDAGSTYGGYLGLDAAAILDPSDIILDPKTNVYITKSLGIGTNSPGTINSVAFSGVGLHVKFGTLGRTITEGSNEASYLLNNSGASANQRIKYIQSTSGNLAIGSFDDNGLARPQITVLNSGNVGIGRSTSITAKLFVEGPADTSTISTSSTPAARINNGGAISNWIGSNGYNYGYIQSIQDDGSNNLKPLSLQPLGSNVGIGTTNPGALLHLVGTTPELRIATAVDGDTARLGLYEDAAGTHHGGYIQYVGGGDTLRLGIVNSTVNTDVITIKDNFNVGIGTTGPQSKLQVAGGIQMADDTDTASATKVGTMRYRTGTEYVDVDGTNLISNPDFTSDTAWTKETGWTISGGELVATAAAGNTACYQTPGLTNGSIYRCTFTISEYTSGKVSFRAGTSAANTFFNAVGTYSVIMTAGGTLQGRFGLESGVTTTLKISQCSIVEVVAEDASYADMCMQTGASTYEWVNIVRNTY